MKYLNLWFICDAPILPRIGGFLILMHYSFVFNKFDHGRFLKFVKFRKRTLCKMSRNFAGAIHGVEVVALQLLDL